MPIPLLDQWMESRLQTSPLSLLKGTTVGVEASHFLDQYLKPYSKKEPLLPALGGFPFTLQHAIERDLDALSEADITTVFVFSGLEFATQVPDSDVDLESASLVEQAWNFYDQGQAGKAVNAFCDAGSKASKPLYKFLQRILVSRDIDFLVAPYSASAQLAYLLNESPQFVDVLYGSSEVLLFDVPQLVTQITTTAEDQTCTWITKKTCQDGLSLHNEQHFFEFCLLLGSSFIRTFPPFEDISFPGSRTYIRDAIGIYNASARNAIGLCLRYEDHRMVQKLDYANALKNAMLAVHNHVVYLADGSVEPMNIETAHAGIHEFIGHRLPLELYYYIQRGVIEPTVSNWFSSGLIRIARPLGTTDSEDYRRLVKSQLGPIRIRSMRLLVDQLNRFFRSKTITVRPWFNEKDTDTWSASLNQLPSLDRTVSEWRLPLKYVPPSLRKQDVNSPGAVIAPCFEALRDSKTVKHSFAKPGSQPLEHEVELLANTVLRLLDIEGYTYEDHKLTPWGKALSEAMRFLGPSPPPGIEEGVFLIVEMLRLDVMNPTEVSPGLTGSANITGREKRFITLISRVACAGKLAHRADRNYSGPLSRHVLEFSHKISAVRTALRGLIETVFVNSLLAGDSEREDCNFTKISLRLPFIDDLNCGLGLLVRTYLENLYVDQKLEATSPETREAVKEQGKIWFPDILGMNENLELAFKIWDAVYVAIRHSGGSFTHEKLFDDANAWLQDRR